AVLATALVVEGDVLQRAAATDQAIERLLEASELARTRGLMEQLGRACHSLGQIDYARGDLATADELGRAAVTAGRAAGETLVALMAASLVRTVALARGDLDAALDGAEDDRATAAALGFPMPIAQI